MVVSPAPPLARPPAAGVRSGAPGASAVVGLAAATATVLVWWFFVTTRTGQLLDEAAFDGAEFGRNRLLVLAEPVLSVISVPFIGVVLLSAMLLAVARRRALLAIQVALLVGGANLTTQVLKRWLFDRPDLDVGDPLANALPSGHTTAAASVSAALLFVVPRRLRPTAAVVGVLYTVATGISTLVGRWHRPSDVVAAVLVVLAWSALAGALGRATGEPAPGARTVAWLLVLGGLVTGALATLAVLRTHAAIPGGLDGRAELLTAYGGGALGVAAVTALAFGVLLLLRRGSPGEPSATGRAVRGATSPVRSLDARS